MDGIQEGWLKPTERALVSAISLTHIILLPHESHAGMSLRVQTFGYIKRVQGTFWLPLGTPLGQSRYILHRWKENSMLVKRLAA